MSRCVDWITVAILNFLRISIEFLSSFQHSIGSDKHVTASVSDNVTASMDGEASSPQALRRPLSMGPPSVIRV
jgi:hypothetical protein